MSVSRSVIILAVIACCVLFAVGILIGHFAISKESDDNDTDSQYLLDTKCDGTPYSTDKEKYKKE